MIQIGAKEMGEQEPKSMHLEAEEMYKDNSQLRIEDFVFPYGDLDAEGHRRGTVCSAVCQ